MILLVFSDLFLLNCRVAESPHEQQATAPGPATRRGPASAFWSKYWSSRVPDYRDLYSRDYGDYGDYDADADNRVGEQLRGPRTKSRLDPRHVQSAPAEELSRTFDNTNALRLKSSAGHIGQSSYPVLVLTLVWAIILTL